MTPRPDSIQAVGLKAHIDAYRDRQNGRGYRDFVRFLTHGDEFGEPMPVEKIGRAFNRSGNTIWKWIGYYCSEQGIAVPAKMAELMKRKVNK